MEVKTTRTDPTFTLTMSTDEAKLFLEVLRCSRLANSSTMRSGLYGFAFKAEEALRSEIEDAGVL